MSRKSTLAGITLACLMTATPVLAQQGAATGSLSQRIGRHDVTKLNTSQSVHAGAGPMRFGALLGAQALSTNLIFVHRGEILPGGGIGQHFHNHCEEMFVILSEGSAEFTINGRTSTMPTPAGVPDTMGNAHGIYNPGSTPIQWLNINVGETKTYDNFDLGDNRVGAAKDAIPQFINFRIDQTLLRPAPATLNPTGAVTFRRLLGPNVFYTPWSYFDHIAIPAGASIAPAASPAMSVAYYVYKGAGSVTVNGETVAIKAGDAVPVDLNQGATFTQNGAEPLELLAIGVAKDMAAKTAYSQLPPPRPPGGRGAPGRGAPAAGRGN